MVKPLQSGALPTELCSEGYFPTPHLLIKAALILCFSILMEKRDFPGGNSILEVETRQMISSSFAFNE